MISRMIRTIRMAPTTPPTIAAMMVDVLEAGEVVLGGVVMGGAVVVGGPGAEVMGGDVVAGHVTFRTGRSGGGGREREEERERGRRREREGGGERGRERSYHTKEQSPIHYRGCTHYRANGCMVAFIIERARGCI